MKKIITIINNTRRVVKLLSDPRLVDALQKQLIPTDSNRNIQKLGVKDIFYHKYFMVQIVN